MSLPARQPRPDPRAFLGRGLAFPLAVDARGKLAVAEGETKVDQASWLSLSTALGERVMRPRLGCGAHDQLFAPGSAATITRIVDQVRRALTTLEPRIAVLDVRADLSTDGAALMVEVDYKVRSNNAIGNLVYPFFVTEGF